MKENFGLNTEILWHDRKRYWGMPISFTRYNIVKKQDVWTKLFTSIGLLSTHEEEVQMFRIFDVSVYQSLFDKMFGVGTLTLYCNDESSPKILISKVKNPIRVRNMLASLIEEDRKKHGVRLGEFH